LTSFSLGIQKGKAEIPAAVLRRRNCIKTADTKEIQTLSMRL